MRKLVCVCGLMLEMPSGMHYTSLPCSSELHAYTHPHSGSFNQDATVLRGNRSGVHVPTHTLCCCPACASPPPTRPPPHKCAQRIYSSRIRQETPSTIEQPSVAARIMFYVRFGFMIYSITSHNARPRAYMLKYAYGFHDVCGIRSPFTAKICTYV